MKNKHEKLIYLIISLYFLSNIIIQIMNYGYLSKVIIAASICGMSLCWFMIGWILNER